MAEEFHNDVQRLIARPTVPPKHYIKLKDRGVMIISYFNFNT